MKGGLDDEKNEQKKPVDEKPEKKLESLIDIEDSIPNLEHEQKMIDKVLDKAT